MPTRRRFLSAIASLCAAAGLSRLAGGAGDAEPVPAVPQPPEAPPKLLSWTQPETLPSGWSGTMRVTTNASEWRNGKWQPSPWRLMRFERGRLVEMSPELPEAP
jgi:hypothetical protein